MFRLKLLSLGFSLNIYIYGNDSFKKDIHKILNKANIKYKLDDASVIEDISSLKDLKSHIKANPKDIYLIDDEKIIKKNGFSKKIKFLIPKDGIEEEYLLENGIADLSVNSIEEIPKHIILKYEQEKIQNEDIQETMANIVDNAYSDDIELDEELASLLSHEEEKEKEKNDIDLDRIDQVEGFEEDVGLNNIASDYDNDIEEKESDEKENTKEENKEENFELTNEEENVEIQEESLEEEKIEDLEESKEETIEEEKEDTKNDIEEIEEKGEDMSDEFSEFDLLNEEDILSALNDVEVTNSDDTSSKKEVKEEKNEQIELNSSNINDISELISKLLNNKTLEITVKIKD